MTQCRGVHYGIMQSLMVMRQFSRGRCTWELTSALRCCRKHVITEQGYIPQLVRCFEEEGVRPVPIFINGNEAHTVVRAYATTTLFRTACNADTSDPSHQYHLASCERYLLLPASVQAPSACVLDNSVMLLCAFIALTLRAHTGLAEGCTWTQMREGPDTSPQS